MTRQTKRRLRRLRQSRKRKLPHDVPGTSQHDGIHAFMRADGKAVEPSRVWRLELEVSRSETQRPRDHVAAEMPFAHEQRHDKDAWCREALDHFGHLRFLFPERLADRGEDVPPPQPGRV